MMFSSKQKPFRSQATRGLTQAERDRRHRFLAVLAEKERMKQKLTDSLRFLGSDHTLHPDYSIHRNPQHRLAVTV